MSVGIVIDDVVAGKSLCIEQFAWLKHSHLNICDYVLLTMNSYQREAILCRHRIKRFSDRFCRACGEVFHEKCSNLCVVRSAAGDGCQRLVDRLTVHVVPHRHDVRHREGISIRGVLRHERICQLLPTHFIFGGLAIVLDQCRGDQVVFSACYDRPERFIDLVHSWCLSFALSVSDRDNGRSYEIVAVSCCDGRKGRLDARADVICVVAHDRRRDHAVSVLCRNSSERLIRTLSSEAFAGMVDGHDERFRVVNYEFLNTSRDPPHRVFCQRLFALKDALCRYRPVDALGGGAVRQFKSQLDRLAVFWGVCRFCPDNGATVAAGDEIEACPCRRCAVVAGFQRSVLYLVSQSFL